MLKRPPVHRNPITTHFVLRRWQASATFVLSHGGGETPVHSLSAEDLLCFFSLQQTSQTYASAPDGGGPSA